MEIINLSLYCHHQNDSCIKMGSEESHFNDSALGCFHSLISTETFRRALTASVDSCAKSHTTSNCTVHTQNI